MPNLDYPNLLCLHIHLPSLVIIQILPGLQVCSLSSVLITWENIIFRNFINITFFSPNLHQFHDI